MSWYVVVWQLGIKPEGLSYEDYAYGPFLDDERAHTKKTQIERALKRRGVEDWDVAVEEMITGSYPAREIADWIAAMDTTKP